MMNGGNMDFLSKAAVGFGTPCYIFDTDVFADRVRKVRQAFGEKVGLCYSIKANPFLTASLPEEIGYIEVCSPGELSVCESIGADMSRIIFSGVNKTFGDTERAFTDGAAIFTAESSRHLSLINSVAEKHGSTADVVLRLSHGNQFGIDEQELCELIADRDSYKNLRFIGLHYFTGTQKSKPKVIANELTRLDELLCRLKEDYGFLPSHIEYGTGLAVEYFKDFTDDTDLSLLGETAEHIRAFAEKYPLTVEMGRFFAAPCGYYLTGVNDIKTTNGVSYVICDGGINHLNYYGQNMAMKVPPIAKLGSQEGETADYCLCGSLCTGADILVRKVTLPKLAVDDTLVFSKCGAYSVCEGLSVFLSRSLPAVCAYSRSGGLVQLRGHAETYPLNCGGADK